MVLELRRIVSHVEEIRLVAGRGDEGEPLRRVAVCGIYRNPFAGAGYVEDLSAVIEASSAVGTDLGSRASRLLDAPVQSYGKGGLVGTGGEQEHVNAAVTSVFGKAFRDAVGGGKAWITSVTKVAGPGAVIDVPLAYKDEIWVRSHYDAIEVHIPAGPAPDELIVITAVSNRGRLNARVGGMTVEESGA